MALEGKIVIETEKAKKAADYTNIYGWMLRRDKLNRNAKQKPYEELLEEYEFLSYQLDHISDHKRSDKDETRALNIVIKKINWSLKD